MTRRDLLSTVLLLPAAGVAVRGRQPSADGAFSRGLTALHIFDYERARVAFREAQGGGSSRVMVAWGETLTYHHPLWNETDLEAGQAALVQLGATPEARLALAVTDKERDWLRAAEALFAPQEQIQRERTYLQRMTQMAERYPDDVEVRTFQALALLGSNAQPRDLAAAMSAAAALEDVVRAQAGHVGAVHYLLHAYDDAAHAPLALHYADAFAALGLQLPYAQHLPSRTYLALGLWDRATEANQRAAKATGGPANGPGAVQGRAQLWLLYSLLQEGRQAEAKSLLAQIESAASAAADDLGARAAVAFARATWLVETRRWADARLAPAPEGLPADATAAELFAAGMGAFRAGNRVAGNDALLRMAALVGDGDRRLRTVTSARPPTPAPVRPGVTPIPTPRPGLPPRWGATGADTALPPPAGGPERRLAAIMAQQLEAVLIFSEGRRDEAIVLARQAAAVADDLDPVAGPPLPVKPGHELVADLLMDVRRPGEAIPEYEASLRRFPRRPMSLLGLARAAAATKDLQKSQAALAELRRVWQRADKTLPELREVLGAPASPSR